MVARRGIKIEQAKDDDSDSKVVVVLSDGQSSNCRGGKENDPYYSNPHPWEYDIAKEWREAGVKIIYVQVGEALEEDVQNVKTIVGDQSDNILTVHDYSKLDKTVISDVVKRMCSHKKQ
ncbi:hypothetical protein OSTOST_04772 [Ostertagia ostertagi]